MLIAIPLLIVPVVIYNLVILLGGGGADPLLGPTAVLGEVMFRVPMTSGAVWSVSIGDPGLTPRLASLPIAVQYTSPTVDVSFT